jgi:hypothetical protein
MAGNPAAADTLASQSVELARRSGAPVCIAQSLVALAGALADRDPSRARALLTESLELRASLDLEGPFDATRSTLIAARMTDWPLALKIAPDAIRNLSRAGDRPYLAGILNVVARAFAGSDPASAAILQGAVPGLAAAAGSHAVSRSGDAEATASFITELRRQTTASLKESLGEDRLRQLRTEGAAMDGTQVVAYALNALDRAERH